MGHHHAHHHDHGHHHHEPGQYNVAFAVSVGLNLAFVIVEVIYALYANSMSLLADAGHNLGDVVGLLLAWGANFLMTKESSDRFSYGFKKTSILASLTNALILVATSAIIVYESINKLIHPEAINEWVVMVVAFIGILVNGGTALLFIKGSQEDLNIKGAFTHLAMDALLSFGVVITGAVVYFTGYVWMDPVVGLAIVAAILWGTWGLLVDSVHLLLMAVPRRIDQKGVKDYLENFPGVVSVHDLHIWGLSTREVAMTVHLVKPEKALTDAERDEISQALKGKFSIHHTTIQVECGACSGHCDEKSTCT